MLFPDCFPLSQLGLTEPFSDSFKVPDLWTSEIKEWIGPELFINAISEQSQVVYASDLPFGSGAFHMMGLPKEQGGGD